jgi:hypothetical protein
MPKVVLKATDSLTAYGLSSQFSKISVLERFVTRRCMLHATPLLWEHEVGYSPVSIPAIEILYLEHRTIERN